MFCCTSPITSDPPLCAASHVPVSGGHPGAIQARFRKRRTGRSSGLAGKSFAMVLNAAARVIYRMRSADHITDALACLHWLRVPERIEYKVAVLTHKVLHGSAPRYLGPLVAVPDLPGRRTLRSGGTNRLTFCQTFNSRWPGVHVCWTPCLEHSDWRDNDVADTLYLPSTT